MYGGESEICQTIWQCNLKAERIKQMDSYRYLGYSITTDGKCILEIKRRIGQAKNGFKIHNERQQYYHLPRNSEYIQFNKDAGMVGIIVWK